MKVIDNGFVIFKLNNMNTFKLKILTPYKKLFEGEVVSFTVPTKSGEITVLKNHAPLVSLISIGEIKITNPDGSVEKLLVQGGVIDVKNSSKDSEVSILADQLVSLDSQEDLNEEINRAKEAMQIKNEEIDFAFEESVIERNLFLKRFKQK